MGTNYIAPTWRMPENLNKDRLSNYSIDLESPATCGIRTSLTTEIQLIPKASFSFWFYQTSNSSSGYILDNENTSPDGNSNFRTAFRNSSGTNNLDFVISKQSPQSIGSIDLPSLNNWHHIAVVFNGSFTDSDAAVQNAGRLKVYLNGAPQTVSFSGNMPTTTPGNTSGSLSNNKSLVLGNGSWQTPVANVSWNGKLSQMSIFTYDLSPSQVTYLYNLNNPMTISGAEPIAYWPLGDNSNPTANPGYPNIVSDADSVFDFGASNEEIDAPGPYADGTQGDLTISAWVKQDSITTSYNPFICTGFTTSMTQPQIAMALRNVSGNRLYLFYNGGGGSNYIYAQDVMTEANRWYHCAFVRNGSTGKLYVDGQEVPTLNSANFSINPLVTTEDSEMTLGAWRYDGNITSLNGELSNVCLWKTALTDGVGGQIEELYNNGLPLLELSEIPQDNNLLAWYKLNQSAVLTPGITAEPWRVSVATGNPDYTNTDDGAYTFNGEFRCRDTGAYDFSDSFYLTFRTITGAHNNITLTSTGGYKDTDGGIRLQYRIDGGSWVQFQEVDGSGTGAWTFTAPSSVNCSTSYELRAQMHGSAYPQSYISLYDMTISASSGTLLTETFGQTNYTGARGGSISNPPPVVVSADHWDIPDNRSAYPQSFNFDNNTTTPAPSFDSSFNPDGYTKLTFSIWAYAENYYERGTLFATFEDTANKYSDSNFRISPSRNRFNVSINGDFICALNVGAAFQSITPNGVWNCITLVYDGTFTDADTAVQNAGRLKFYTNKVYKAFDTFTNDVPSSIISNSLGSRIGAANPTLSNGSSRGAFLGKLSNLQIWDTDLSLLEVATLYNNGVPLPTASVQPSNLKLWTRLDNSSKWNTTTSQWNIPTNPTTPIPSSISAIVKSSASSYIENTTPSGIDLTNPTTCSFWTKTTQADVAINSGSLGGGGDFAIIGDRILIFRSGTNYRYFDVNTTILNDNNWHNLILYTPGYANADIASTRLFMDGLELTASTTVSSGNPASVNNKPILGVGNVYADITEASFSNAVIWSSDQTANITEIYNNGTPASSYTGNPILWWELNNLTSGLDDLSGNGNNGVAVGPVFTVVEEDIIAYQLGISSGMTEANLIDENVSVVNGESDTLPATALVQSDLTRKLPFSNYSVLFNGIDESFNCGPGFQYTDITVSCWVRFEGMSPNYQRILQTGVSGGGIGFMLALDQSGDGLNKITAGWSNPTEETTRSTVAVSLDTWYNVLFTRNASGIKLYIDGVDVSGPSSAGWGYGSGNNLELGRKPGGGSYLDGDFSNVAIWNSVLTQEEILDVYNNGVPTNLNTSFTPGQPEYWWPMDEDNTYFNGSVLIARDAVGSTDATGDNVIQENIVGNAPGSTANGVGSNLTIADLKGDMQNSTNNSYSINMADYADGITNPADSGRSTNVP